MKLTADNPTPWAAFIELSVLWNSKKKLANLTKLAADNPTPWAAFIELSALWNSENLKQLADEFPNFANQGLVLGDATIKQIANYYNK